MTRTNAPSIDRSSRSSPIASLIRSPAAYSSSSSARSRRACVSSRGGPSAVVPRGRPAIHHGRVAAGRLEQALGLLDGQRLGQEPLRPGQVEVGGDVDADEALAVREPVEALERGRPSAQAARREPRVATPAATRPRREVVDGRVGRRGPAAADAARRREVVQVAPIGADRRRGEAALDVQVGQVGVDRAHRGRARSDGRPQPARATPPRQASARSRSSRALASVAAPPVSPPSIWASSTIRPSRSSSSTSVTVRPSRSRLAIR